MEQTGAHTQFYDKFNIRYNISQILENAWKNQLHRQKLREVCKKQNEGFLRFVNLLINDTTYLLDEGISKLKEIHLIEIEMEDQNVWQSQSQVLFNLICRNIALSAQEPYKRAREQHLH